MVPYHLAPYKLTIRLRKWTGNQCSWINTGLIWSNFLVKVTIRAAVFCTDCKLFIIIHFGKGFSKRKKSRNDQYKNLPWLFHIACRVSTDIYPDCTRYRSSSPIVYRYIDPESTLLLLRRAVLNQTGGTGDGCSSSKPTLLGSDRPLAGAACLAMVQGIYPTRSRLWWSVFRLYLWEYR